MSTLSKEQALSDATEAVIRFHREQQGHAPRRSRASLVKDMFVVHSEGVFTPTEESLVDTHEGRKLVQSARREQRALTRRQIEAEVGYALGCQVLRSFYDLDVRDGQQLEVYMLDQNLENRLS